MANSRTGEFSALDYDQVRNGPIPRGLRTNFLVDQDGLETGRLTLVNFKPNGQIDVEMLRRPFNMISVMTYIYGLGWSVDRLKFENIGGGDWANEP